VVDNTNQVKTIYEELEFPDAPAMLIKAQLVVKIAESLRQRGWSQQHAAKMLGLTQPKLSKMLRGQFRGISEIKMMDCLTKLGREVKILIGPETESSSGRVEVIAA
jgi:predicted XRE-type DNA-binding protein